MNFDSMLLKILLPLGFITFFVLIFIGNINFPKTGNIKINTNLFEKYFKLFSLAILALLLSKMIQSEISRSFNILISLCSVIVILFFSRLTRN